MDLGVVVSYIIAGMLLMAILMMNMSVSSSSTELTMTQITREKAAALTDMLEHDILKMGYNKTSKTSPIIELADSQRIRFRSNIDDSNDKTVETITWELTSDPVSATENPNDLELKRTVSGGINSVTPITLGVTEFEIKYFDQYGEDTSNNMLTPVSNPEDIKQLYIKLVLESPQRVYQGTNDNGRYVKTVWEKRFSPPNIE
ncbi:hypothetical protein LQ318_06955 [Aliifodinibius salicampi]|uniref:Type II secretion system protein n=1 Tax=Fodinibius salicampi TaxID=1920655 RepID=A0ABT3PXS3_9BACT|nr:hypothetical protein [Fodinibius salicampi]MCW9712638.1 hypothetical protein [Fodinibius salicampi]